MRPILIRITSVPPGTAAPERIRAEWVGLTIPIVLGDEANDLNSSSPSGENAEGYIVRGSDAVKALVDAGRAEAARFWSTPACPAYLRFSKNCCVLTRMPATISKSRIVQKPEKYYCSFCGKSQDEVKKLVAGWNAFICNECHELAADIFKEVP